ncbi:MAG: TIGR01777 family oxidoreductase, partial [Chloroflexota bacterium]
TIGRRLVDYLIEQGHLVTVVSRSPYKPATLPAKINFAQWDGKTADGWGHYVDGADAVVNLAGAGVADGRWTDARKKEIRESRTNAAQAVIEAIQQAEVKPKVLIGASAIGYYGIHKSHTLTEQNPPGSGFLPEVCKEWEAAAEPVEAMGVRRVTIRTGVVLDPKGGAFPKIVMPFNFLAGGPIGSGRQWFSWIHYLDEVRAIEFLIKNEEAEGPFNLTAPHPLRNRDFAKIVGKVLSRPAFAPAPGLVFKVMFGEMSEVLLGSQRVLPQRLQSLGFTFKYSEAEEAVRDLLGVPDPNPPVEIEEVVVAEATT